MRYFERRPRIIWLWLLIPFFAQAELPPPDTVKTFVKINQNKIYCVDTGQLAGQMVSIEDICSNTNGTYVNFFLLQDEYCMSYDGLEVGTETACLVYCDDTGACDTTVLEVEVVPDSVSLLPPIAVDDAAFLYPNQSVTIDLVENDVLPNDGLITGISLLNTPYKGTATLLPEGLLTYIPFTDVCGTYDSLTYEVCNLVACDTADVRIEIAQCIDFDGLYIFEGISPNGDGINDYWKILGLEQYPNHKIQVFNRWGNKVFETKNYQNDWDGTWDANPLPTGTYFYIIDDGFGKKYTGYLAISY